MFFFNAVVNFCYKSGDFTLQRKFRYLLQLRFNVVSINKIGYYKGHEGRR